MTVNFSVAILLGAAMAYYVLLSSAFYGIVDGLVIFISGSQITDSPDSYTAFGTRYIPIVLLGLIYPLSIMKEKSSFVRLNSGGILFVIFNVLCLIAVGLRALGINTFTTSGSAHISSSDKMCHHDWNCLKHNDSVHIALFASSWATLAGVLTVSFFLHSVVTVVLKNNAHQEKNSRDLSLGYLAVGTCYALIGILGYFGFRGNGFPQGDITSNALDMFASDNPFAFIIRFMLCL
jgi:hypothetical protein